MNLLFKPLFRAQETRVLIKPHLFSTPDIFLTLSMNGNFQQVRLIFLYLYHC